MYKKITFFFKWYYCEFSKNNKRQITKSK